MRRGVISAVGTAVTVLLVSCSGTSTTATSSSSDHTTASMATESSTPSATAKTVEHKTGKPVSVQTAVGSYTGSYTLTVGTPLGSAVSGGGSVLEVGVPIKIDKVAGSPLVSTTYFVLGRVSDPTYPSGWSPSSDPIGGDSAADRSACRGVPTLPTALNKAGLHDEDAYMFLLTPSVKAAACITFFYGRTDKPTTVGLNPDGGNPDSTYPALTWQVRIPGKAATPR